MGWIIIIGIVLLMIIIIGIILNKKGEGIGKNFVNKLKDCCKHRK